MIPVTRRRIFSPEELRRGDTQSPKAKKAAVASTVGTRTGFINKELLVMRRPGVVGLDAFQFQSFHGGGLALDIFFKPFDQPALLDDHRVHLLHLMLKMREVRFNV